MQAEREMRCYELTRRFVGQVDELTRRFVDERHIEDMQNKQ